MTSLDDEFKKLLGDKYAQIHKLEYQCKNPSVTSKDRDETLYDMIELQNSLLNNESSTTSKDPINVSTNLMEYAKSWKDQVSNFQTNIELENEIKNLLEKVDKIIEYLEYSNRHIDEKIKKAIDDFSSKRENSKG